MAGSRGAGRRRVGGVLWWLARDAEPARAEPLLRAALDALRSGRAENQKRGRRKALYPLRLEAGGARPEGAEGVGDADHLLKASRYGALEGLRRRVTGSKARRELALAEAAAARGVPAPIPLAAGEERRACAVRACYLLLRVREGFRDLRSVREERSVAPAERRALAAAFGAFTRQVHDAGLFQDDFAPNNFLLRRGPPPELLMIDFERARLRRANDARARRFMLGKLDRELAGAPPGERMRFLLAYAGGERAEARRWWGELDRYAARLARRDLEHLTRAARGDGRRFRELAHAGWRGLARADAEPAALRTALEAETPPGARAFAAGPHRVLELRGGRGEARRALARATVLAKRGGLAPAPLAAAFREGHVRLLLERDPHELPLAEAPDRDAARRAVRTLAGRLLRLGRLEGGLAPERVLLAPGPEGALQARWLPGPELRLRGRGEPRRARRAAELAARLLP